MLMFRNFFFIYRCNAFCLTVCYLIVALCYFISHRYYIIPDCEMLGFSFTTFALQRFAVKWTVSLSFLAKLRPQLWQKNGLIPECIR